jgi:hypothetical protein
VFCRGEGDLAGGPGLFDTASSTDAVSHVGRLIGADRAVRVICQQVLSLTQNIGGARPGDIWICVPTMATDQPLAWMGPCDRGISL